MRRKRIFKNPHIVHMNTPDGGVKKTYVDPNGQITGMGQFAVNKAPKKTNYLKENYNDQKPINLLGQNRKTYETYYNNYYEDNFGTLKSNRIKIKGIQFYSKFGELLADVTVESKNEYNIITKFEINPNYKGMGFARDLLSIAKASLTANAVEVEMDRPKKIAFFEANGFKKIKVSKQSCILVLQNEIEKPPISDVTSCDRSDSHFEMNNNLYNTGGFDYEGYRGYI